MTAFLVDSVEIAASKVVGTPMLANALNAKLKGFKASLPVAVYADAGKMLAASIPKGMVLIGAIINGAGNAAATNGQAGASTVNVSIGSSSAAEAYVAEVGLDEPGFYPVKTGSVDASAAYDVYVHIDAAITVSATTDTVEVTLVCMSI